MKIYEHGKLYDENLRHPISAFYVHGNPDGTNFSDIILHMFGYSF